MTKRSMQMVLLASSLLMAGLATADSPAPFRACGMTGPVMGMAMAPGMMDHDMMWRAVPAMGHGMMGAAMSTHRIMALPDLSDQQRQKLTQRHRQLEKQMLDLQKQGLDARFALEDAFAQDRPDPRSVGNALDGVFNVRKQMIQAAITAHNDMLGMLTDEQRESLESHGWRGKRAKSGMMGHGTMGHGMMEHHRQMQQAPDSDGDQ